ncbi:MAG TPA: hypothetical protein VFS19_03985 [Planctomycetota bacterium]|nr:hypothetical protein [Planctomycetota bacterium]
MSWYNHPRVVAAVNLLGAAALAAAPYVMFPKPPDASFLRLWYGFILLFSLFWIWMFIVNPRVWAVVKDGRLSWRRGLVFPSSGSVDVADIKCVLIETVITPPNSVGVGNAINYYVVLKDETKLKASEQAVTFDCLQSMREVNPLIEKRETSVPLNPRAREDRESRPPRPSP